MARLVVSVNSFMETDVLDDVEGAGCFLPNNARVGGAVLVCLRGAPAGLAPSGGCGRWKDEIDDPKDTFTLCFPAGPRIPEPGEVPLFEDARTTTSGLRLHNLPPSGRTTTVARAFLSILSCFARVTQSWCADRADECGGRQGRRADILPFGDCQKSQTKPNSKSAFYMSAFTIHPCINSHGRIRGHHVDF